MKQKKQMLCRIGEKLEQWRTNRSRRSWGRPALEPQELGEASSGAGAGHTDKSWACLLSTPDLCPGISPSARRHHHAQQSALGQLQISSQRDVQT